MAKLLYCPICGKILSSINKCCPNCKATMPPKESLFDSSYYKNKSEQVYGLSAQAFKILIQEEASKSIHFDKSKCVYDIDMEENIYGSKYKQANSDSLSKTKEVVEDDNAKQAKVIKEIETKKANSGKNALISALVSLGSLGLAFGVAYLRIEFMIYVGVIASAIGFFAFLGFLGEWRIHQKDLALVRRNFKEYEKKCEKVAEQNAFYQAGQKAEWERTHPVCPSCGSRNTSRISNLNRTASVATWGLASSKIGKQYECKNCKHKW